MRRILVSAGRKLDHITALRSQGYIIELDHACRPRVREWKDANSVNPFEQLIASGYSRYREWLEWFLVLADHFTAISALEPADEHQPYWTNPYFPPLDAIALSGIVAKINPHRYVEIGSGNSTKFVRRAIADLHLRTRIISIDPHPRAVIDQLCDEVIRDGLENIDLSLFSSLGKGDVVFIDSSHRSFQNSDVTIFFTEVLPRLGVGCIYGIHDIFLPFDYPPEWFSRYYNEQYVLMAYLLGGAGGDEIIFPAHFVQRRPELFQKLDPILKHPAFDDVAGSGGAFWMTRGN